MGLLKIKFRLEESLKVMALLDTGAEINMITKKLMKDANLAIK